MVFQIGPLTVSPDHPPVVVAELGVNHDGSPQRAIRLLELAREAGADAVKLQVFRAGTLVQGDGLLAAYQQGVAESSAELLRRLELTPEALEAVAAHARRLGVPLLATPFSLSDVPVCRRLGLSAVKIASPDVINHLLLEAAAGLGLPMLVSTGAATLDELDASVAVLESLGASHLLLHCVSAYPTPPEQAHLTFIRELAGRYGRPVGYSDHVPGTRAGALAVAAGAVLLERHFTDDTTRSGPDHAASSDPGEFARYVAEVREAWRLLGCGLKRVLPVEEDVRKVSRQSLVLEQPLRAGEPLQKQHLTTRRPGTGLLPDTYRRWLGRRARRDLPAGTMLTEHDLAGTER
ncbi:MAG: N-acetylneuraminate synthase family protein [Tepidisphaerales bacterium]